MNQLPNLNEVESIKKDIIDSVEKSQQFFQAEGGKLIEILTQKISSLSSEIAKSVNIVFELNRRFEELTKEVADLEEKKEKILELDLEVNDKAKWVSKQEEDVVAAMKVLDNKRLTLKAWEDELNIKSRRVRGD